MSHAAVSLVKSRRFGSTSRKAVALVLADYCDAEFSCFVGQARLAFEAEVGERSVRRILAELEAAGVIRRHHRTDGQGHRTSDRIMLVPAAIASLPDIVAARSLPATDDRPPANHDRLPATGDSPTGQALAGEPSVEPSVEPSAERGVVPAAPTRRQDPVWDAVMDACGIDATGINRSARGAYNRAVADLRSVDATTDEIHRRARALAARWGDDKLTPSSLARHWAEFAGTRLTVSSTARAAAQWAEATG